jgi:TolA-binding protein
VTAAPEPETPAPDALPAPSRPRHRPARPAAGSAGARTEPRAISPEIEIEAPSEAPAVDRDGAEYDRLAALEPRSPDAALTGYLALARGTSRWADPALFAAARLAVDRHDRRAETLLGIYLQRFPGGANAADARQLLSRLKSDKPER